MAATVVCTCLGANEDALYPTVLRAAGLASALGIRFMVLTFYPLPAASQTSLIDVGALVYAAPPQTSPGAELRVTIMAATQLVTADAYVVWMEPSQDDFVRFAAQLTSMMEDSDCVDIIMPTRGATSGSAYPAQQVHAEALGNLYLNTLLASHSATIAAYSQRPSKSAQVDWFFGPVVMRASLAHHWHSSSSAPLPDEPRTKSSLISLLRAVRAGAKLATPEIAYVHRPSSLQLVQPAGSVGGGRVATPPAGESIAIEDVQYQWFRLEATIRAISDEIRELARATVAQTMAHSAATQEAAVAGGGAPLSSATQAPPPQGETTYNLHELLPHVFPARRAP